MPCIIDFNLLLIFCVYMLLQPLAKTVEQNIVNGLARPSLVSLSTISLASMLVSRESAVSSIASLTNKLRSVFKNLVNKYLVSASLVFSFLAI